MVAAFLIPPKVQCSTPCTCVWFAVRFYMFLGTLARWVTESIIKTWLGIGISHRFLRDSSVSGGHAVDYARGYWRPCSHCFIIMFVTEVSVFSGRYCLLTRDPLFTCRGPKNKQPDPMFTIWLYASTTEHKYEYTQELHNIALLQQRVTALTL